MTKMVDMVVSAEEHRLIGQVVDRLLAGFPQVPQNIVWDLVGSIHQRFDNAPIRDFVPLFVERHTKEKLANLAEAEPTRRVGETGVLPHG